MRLTRSDDDHGDDGLTLLHQRLEAHFAAVRVRRDAHAKGIPIFALEHGLSEAELALLGAAVRAAVSRGNLSLTAWLPLVVYAAELGYAYCGDEYWETFESRTPGWVEHGDRHSIRRCFRDFKDKFGGAEPTGRWAEHFSIICWPITHAVLPTDLQRQLARLLFEYRRALTTDLLADPPELGKRLAARTWHASSRFQNFAQNTNLLGQVAAALLVGDDEESPYLLDSTLGRIVDDLSNERQARRWLRDAKFTATHVRTRGFHVGGRTSDAAAPSAARGRLPAATDPELWLRREDEGWTAYVELPDLSLLAERLPAVHEELGRLRARFPGASGPPLARGRLLYAGQQLRLTEWPEPGTALIALENGSPAVNGLLADQCVLSPGPRWLFRIRDRGLATEVRGKFVRPGHRYVLLSEEALPEELPAWIARTNCATAGIEAYAADVPTVLKSEDLAALRSIGFGAVTEVEIRPAGLVPSLWDGEGTAEWIAGEHPIVAVSSTRAVAHCIFTLDNVPDVLSWPADENEIFVGFEGLGVGPHDVQVSLVPTDAALPIAEGSLAVLVRPPHTRPPSGSFREGLMVLATPVSPTLTEVWDGKAALEVLGPEGARVSVDISLADRSKAVLARRHLSTTLPLDSSGWLNLFASQFRRSGDFQRTYDDAESCDIAVSHDDLGAVSLHCEREFAPLRWAAGRDRDGPFVRLIDNTESSEIQVELFEFSRPDGSRQLPLEAGSVVRWPAGGLVIAKASTARSSVVLPPLVRDLVDLRTAGVTPHLAAVPRSFGAVLRLCELAYFWASASLPADPFGETRRVAVLRAITAYLAGLVGGRHWASVEQRVTRDEEAVPIADLQSAVGIEPYQEAIAIDLGRRTDALRSLEPEKRVDAFATVLATHARTAGVRGENSGLAEFLLRLASEPASLAGLPLEELQLHLELTLASPVLLRAARSLVLAIHALSAEDANSTYRGWAWE